MPKPMLPRRLKRKQAFYPRPLKAEQKPHPLFKGWEFIDIFSPRFRSQGITGMFSGKIGRVNFIDAVVERKGFGTNLLNYLMAKFEENGIETVQSTVRQSAVGFYKKNGFREKFQADKDHVEMEITIKEWRALHSKRNRAKS